MGLKHSKQKNKRNDKDNEIDRMQQISHRGLDQSRDADVGLTKAVDTTKRKDTGPYSMKRRRHEELNMGRELLSPNAGSVQVQTPRKEARPFKPETHSSDEAENQDAVSRRERLDADQRERYICYEMSIKGRRNKARPFNPESDSSEEADIADPDETQPKTGLPHPIQETRPPAK